MIPMVGWWLAAVVVVGGGGGIVFMFGWLVETPCSNSVASLLSITFKLLPKRLLTLL